MTEKNEDRYAEIMRLICNHVAEASGTDLAELDETTNFLTAELLDSFGVMNLILELQTALGISFEPVELVTPEVRTVGGLARLAAQHCEQQ
jgi:acyl carrier protein